VRKDTSVEVCTGTLACQGRLRRGAPGSGQLAGSGCWVFRLDSRCPFGLPEGDKESRRLGTDS